MKIIKYIISLLRKNPTIQQKIDKFFEKTTVDELKYMIEIRGYRFVDKDD